MALANGYVQLPLMQATVALRQLNGFDEQWIDNTDTLTAIELVDRLLLDKPYLASVSPAPSSVAANDKTVAAQQQRQSINTACPGQAIDLPTAERDRLLAAIYINNFGDTIRADMQCSRCEQPFETEFSLADLIATMDKTAAGNQARWLEQCQVMPGDSASLAQPSFLLKNGEQFRLPTGRDELAIAGMDEQQAYQHLLSACLIRSDIPREQSTILAAAEALAPVMDFTLNAHCVECHHQQTFHFAMQRYLLQTLLAHKTQLMPQVHKIASCYGWTLESILNLPRHQRRALVELIDAE